MTSQDAPPKTRHDADRSNNVPPSQHGDEHEQRVQPGAAADFSGLKFLAEIIGTPPCASYSNSSDLSSSDQIAFGHGDIMHLSIGQRMIAETSCHRDEMDRKVIQAVPETDYASQ
jgi:hypothetical protein